MKRRDYKELGIYLLWEEQGPFLFMANGDGYACDDIETCEDEFRQVCDRRKSIEWLSSQERMKIIETCRESGQGTIESNALSSNSLETAYADGIMIRKHCRDMRAAIVLEKNGKYRLLLANALILAGQCLEVNSVLLRTSIVSNDAHAGYRFRNKEIKSKKMDREKARAYTIRKLTEGDSFNAIVSHVASLANCGEHNVRHVWLLGLNPRKSGQRK